MNEKSSTTRDVDFHWLCRISELAANRVMKVFYAHNLVVYAQGLQSVIP